MKRKKRAPPEWKEIQRQTIGLYASGPCSGPGWSSAGYYHAVYQVSEVREVGGKTEYRIRTIEGDPCRYYGEGYSAFSSLFSRYLDYAENERKEYETEKDYVERKYKRKVKK